MSSVDNGLFRLPPELREIIYSYVFGCTDGHTFCVWRQGLRVTLVDGRLYKPVGHVSYNSGRSLRCGAAGLSLLRVSKTIHHEARPVFHAGLRLQMYIDGRQRSATEIKGRDLGPVDDVVFLRHVRDWDVVVRSSHGEDCERLIDQLDRVRDVLVDRGENAVSWRGVTVLLANYAAVPALGQTVLAAVVAMTGVDGLEEIHDPWREATTVFGYSAEADKSG